MPNTLSKKFYLKHYNQESVNQFAHRYSSMAIANITVKENGLYVVTPLSDVSTDQIYNSLCQSFAKNMGSQRIQYGRKKISHTTDLFMYSIFFRVPSKLPIKKLISCQIDSTFVFDYDPHSNTHLLSFGIDDRSEFLRKCWNSLYLFDNANIKTNLVGLQKQLREGDIDQTDLKLDDYYSFGFKQNCLILCKTLAKFYDEIHLNTYKQFQNTVNKWADNCLATCP